MTEVRPTGDRPDFAALFGHVPDIRASAPGRVNLIGEHTDYSGGFVLPTAIPQRTRVELARRSDGRVRAWSANVDPGAGMLEYVLGGERAGRGWLDYVQGVTHVTAAAGHGLSGFDVRVESAVPLGSGLSSSAALEVALLRGLRELYGLSLDDRTLALLAKRAENDFVGAPVGFMDQMASSLAEQGTALLLDTRSLDYERVPLPAGAELIVISSGVAHHHASGEYRTRRAELGRAAEDLHIRELRDATVDDLPRIARLSSPLDRRARHVVTENARVLAAVAALKAGRLEEAGALFSASHRSMRDDFDVSVPEIDLLVELADAESQVFGARLTGGGFGGSIVALAAAGSGASVARRVVQAYRERTGQPGAVLLPAP